MLSKEILEKVRQVEIQTRKMVNDVFSGEYHSIFKGKGMSFSEVRGYQPGDDFRNIDWNVTARQGHPYVKIMEEERELTVYFCVDVSNSGKFGSTLQFKSELAAEICAVLAFSAILNGDKVGLISFTDRIEKHLSPRKGKSNAMQVIREIMFGEPQGHRTNISGGLEFLSGVTRKRSIVFLISDFYDLDFQHALRAASSRHDLIMIHLADPLDRKLPDAGLFPFYDSETGEKLIIDTSSETVRQSYAEKYEERKKKLEILCKRNKIDLIHIDTEKPYVKPLKAFFNNREKRIR